MYKTDESREVHTNSGPGWCKEIGQRIMMAYFLVITVIYPFYAPGGYLRIGEVKFAFFRNVTLVTLAVMILAVTVSFLQKRSVGKIAEQYRHMSVPDWFAYGYLITIMLSYLCSAYKEDALWGADGWHMGAITQMIFILLYFFISRFFPWNSKCLAVWLTAAGVVFLLGILNRYSVYPIVMEGQMETFISTLGNINWFCGYWSVTAPMGIALYWCSEHRPARAAAGVFSVIAILAGITQGSSSAHLVYLAVYGVLLICSVQSNRKFYRFLELCMIFAVSCQIGRLMRYIPGLRYNYGNNSYPTGSWITDLLLDSNTMLWLLAGAALCYGILKISEKRRGFRIEEHEYLKTVISTGLVLIMAGLSVLLLFHGGMLSHNNGTGAETYGGSGIIFQEDWGNGRGTAWNCGIGAYRSMDAVHKIVGIGPDCFADYVYEIPELAEMLIDQFGNQRLTNAHNEWLTILVNTGWLGLFCYAGIFTASVIRYWKRAEEQPLLYVCLLSLIAYMVHNMVSFQQILNTPYIFMALGMGECLARGCSAKAERRKSSGIDCKTALEGD